MTYEGYESISYNIYDKEEIYTDCTVQVWSNTITGDTSFGWIENEWISVKDHLPPAYTDVLVYDTKRDIMYQDYYDGYGFKEDISHWRERLKPPKRGDSE